MARLDRATKQFPDENSYFRLSLLNKSMHSPTVNSSKPIVEYASPAATQGGHHEDLRMLGFTIFLVSESMIFLGLFTAYLIFRSVTPVWPPVEVERELLVPAINSVILISSSFVIHQADVAIKHNQVKKLRTWFAATGIMGAIFLLGQIYEYAHLSFSLKSNLYASSFYVLTGFHGLHVFAGLLLISGVLWRSRQPNHYTADTHFGVAATELYWHFVDVVWVILFILLYIL